MTFGGDQASLVTGNLVQGNYIGTDALGNGNAHLHNNGPGVLLDERDRDQPGRCADEYDRRQHGGGAQHHRQ